VGRRADLRETASPLYLGEGGAWSAAISQIWAWPPTRSANRARSGWF
jgi:hypothetical protein